MVFPLFLGWHSCLLDGILDPRGQNIHLQQLSSFVPGSHSGAKADMVNKQTKNPHRALNTRRGYVLCSNLWMNCRLSVWGAENFGVNPILGFIMLFFWGRQRKREEEERGRWGGLSMLCRGIHCIKKRVKKETKLGDGLVVKLLAMSLDSQQPYTYWV